jgi:phospholipase/carboxylesterase
MHEWQSMTTDNDELLAVITDLIPKLLNTMEAFEQVQRQSHPGRYEELAALLAPFVQQLEIATTRFNAQSFPEDLTPFRESIAKSAEYALRACDGIARHDEGMGMVMKAMRAQCRAQEFIYPLSQVMTPVSQYFLEAPLRGNRALIQQLQQGAERSEVGLINVGNERQQRGGFSLFVPENLPHDAPASLVIALHGGNGHGADFIWSWLREARSHGFLLLAPTSQMDTWSLMGEEHDLPALLSMLDYVKGH